VVPQVLKLSVSGMPTDWIPWSDAATLYARGAVRWEAGDERILLRGGTNRMGEQSTMSIASIIAVADRNVMRATGVPPVLNRVVFERDGNICLYCGQKLGVGERTIDHIVPTSRGGLHVYSNLATSCKGCNTYKDNRTPEEAGMALLVLPYEPNRARFLLLMASKRRVLADQQAWLMQFAEKGRKNLH
jgi:hypothetical protein